MSPDDRGQPRDAAISHMAAPAVAVRQGSSSSEQRAQVSVLAAELRREILRRWPTYYAERAASDAPEIMFSPRECGFSLIFKVDLDFPHEAGRERIIIKIRRQHRNGSFLRDDLTEGTLALSRAEYNEHLKAFQYFAGRRDGLSVVRPLDFLESHNALIVEHAIGNDLSRLVKQDSDLTIASIERCGLWWRLFHHDLHGASDRRWDPEVADSAVDRRLERLRKFGVPARRLERLRQEIRATARRVPPVAVPVGLVHGDCKLRHVWATADGIQVLDFGNHKVGDSWIDPAALVVELSLYSLWSGRINPGAKVSYVQTLLRAYFDGPPPAAFSLYVVDCLLKKWHRRLRHWGSGSGLNRLHRSLKTAGLNKALERFYVDRWFTTQIRAWLALAEGRSPAWLQAVVE